MKKNQLLIFLAVLFLAFPLYAVEPDAYENDDYQELAALIDVGNTQNQKHNFHQSGDQDWYKFYALSSYENPIPYSIEIKNPDNLADAVIEVFDASGNKIAETDDTIAGEEEILELSFRESAIYYIRISQHDPQVYGEQTGYEIRLYHAVMRFEGQFITRVVDAVSNQPIYQPVVKSSSPNRPLYIGSNRGKVVMPHPAGSNFNLTFEADKYQQQTITGLSLQETESKRLDVVYLQPASNQNTPQPRGENLIANSEPITLPDNNTSSPKLSELLSLDGQTLVHMPQVYFNTGNSQTSANIKLVLAYSGDDSGGKALFEIRELYLLDDNTYNSAYPSYINSSKKLLAPLLTIGTTGITNLVFSLSSQLSASGKIQFVLDSYQVEP